MAIEPVQNDSVLSTGLDAAEMTEQSVGEITASVDNEAGQTVAAEAQQSTPEQDKAAALREAQELAHAARQHEAAERAQEFERVPELEQDGPER
jgi:hypothetical protein